MKASRFRRRSHSDAYAQQALGNCLGLVFAQTTDAACHNAAGGGTDEVALVPAE